MNLLSLIGAVGLSAVCGLQNESFTLPANNLGQISVNTDTDTGSFDITIQDKYYGLLTLRDYFDANGYGSLGARTISVFTWYNSYNVSNYVISSYDAILPFSTNVVRSAYYYDGCYFGYIDNFCFFNTRTTQNFVCFTRQYVFLDFFNDKTFTYGYRNYGGYADGSILNQFSNVPNISSYESVFEKYQRFITYDSLLSYIRFSNIDGPYFDMNYSFDFTEFLFSEDDNYQSCYVNNLEGGQLNFFVSDTRFAYLCPYFYMFAFYNEDDATYPVQDILDNLSYDQGNYFHYYGSSSADSYLAGYSVGYSSGEASGYANGQQVGYDNGYTTGYNTGFTNGVAESNDYTFTGLFGAVADTPVLIIRNLFNFDLFGVNMLSVILSLFTGLIIFYLLRKLL